MAVLAATTALAGLLDGFSLLRYGVFVANQSGNVIHTGMGLAGHFPYWPASVASIVAFGLGGLVANRLRTAHRPPGVSPPARLILLAGLGVAVWALADSRLPSDHGGRPARALGAAVGAFVLGTLAVLFVRTAGTATTTTYQTSTVLRTTQGVWEWLAGRGASRSGARRAALFGTIALGCYAAGGAAGATIASHPIWVLVVAELTLAGLLASVRPALAQDDGQRGGRPG